MTLQVLPSEAVKYSAWRRREIRRAVTTTGAIWAGMGDNFSPSFERIAPDLLSVINTAQRRVTAAAAEYVPAVMEQTGATSTGSPRFTVKDIALVGVAGDGRPTETLIYSAVTTAKDAVALGETVPSALRHGREFLSLAVGTLLSDTARTGETLASASHGARGWVRMLNPPSCGRCVILGGKYYRHNNGFERHPGCDCTHIPAAEDAAGDMRTDPAAYLDSLDEAGLRKALGSQANIEAYNNYGADLNQLINAYRHRGDIRTAQIYGRNIKYTIEGMTKRGYAYKQMVNVRALSRAPKGYETGRRVIAPRLMPESIFKIAGSDTARARRMLKEHGWI